LNPDLKVYSTDIAIDADHGLKLKPGMSAKVEIVLAELKAVLHVPIQAVARRGEERVCYVATRGAAEPRRLETGMLNDQFIEIRSGLREGDRVLLNPPQTPPAAAGLRTRPSAGPQSAQAPKPKPAAVAAPAAAPAGASREESARRPDSAADAGASAGAKAAAEKGAKAAADKGAEAGRRARRAKSGQGRSSRGAHRRDP